MSTLPTFTAEVRLANNSTFYAEVKAENSGKAKMILEAQYGTGRVSRVNMKGNLGSSNN